MNRTQISQARALARQTGGMARTTRQAPTAQRSGDIQMNRNQSCAPCNIPVPGSAILGSSQSGRVPESGAVLAMGARYLPWAPADGACPDDVSRLLCWLSKGMCTFNRFGKPGFVPLSTNTVTLPDPTTGFVIDPDSGQSMGVFFPRTWVGEAVFHGIARIKVDFTALVSAGALTNDYLEASAFTKLQLRILQLGTVDQYNVVLNFEADDARASTDIPGMGGFFFSAGTEFVPFMLAPELFTFDFAGTMPGVSGTDAYTLSASVKTYWVQVC